MDKDKEKQEISIIGRLFSLDALIFIMGVVSLVYGVATAKAINIFWGVLILTGFFVLMKVRKKDWKAHWEEQEMLRRAREERSAREKGKSDAGKE